MKIVCGTGHRDINSEHREPIIAKVKSVCESADHFIIGGARGFDTLALSVVCDLIEGGKRLPATIVVPATADQQPAEARLVISRAISLGAKLIELGLPYTGESLKQRNRHMIDLGWELAGPGGSCVLLAYWRGQYKSGTYSAIHCYGKSGPPRSGPLLSDLHSIEYIPL